MVMQYKANIKQKLNSYNFNVFLCNAKILKNLCSRKITTKIHARVWGLKNNNNRMSVFIQLFLKGRQIELRVMK
jgi:hypothetical protein